MSRKAKPDPDVTEPTEAAPESPTAEQTPPAPEDEATALRREVAELQDQQLRLMAELQNQQKRALRDKQEAQRYAESEFARELLVVIDDLERTLDSAKATTDAQALAEGVRIIYDHFLKVLRGRHIAPIESVGRPFDPAFHEALLQQPSADQPAGTVLQELARGYTMHERVLRPSRVIVSSGPAPAAPPPSTNQPEPQV
jgi:molecular chaperone GrpE